MLAGVGILVLLALAWTLEPDPRGFGTHTQLGLPACRTREWLGFHCPACGVTTSLVLTGRGRLVSAWDAQPLGPLVLALLLGMGAYAWILRRRGKDADLSLLTFDPRWLYLAGSVVLAAWWWTVTFTPAPAGG